MVVPLRAMAQALRNVLQNGLDASDASSDVALVVASGEHEFRFEVVDRGSGMPSNVLARAIEPFFTTKEPGRGMGLGLYLTRSVVDFVGGELDIASDPGKGTRVLLTVPGKAATNHRIAPSQHP
jgi:two-component system sensor histidine kinase RegB